MTVIGVGNAWGRDDTAGLLVARRLRERGTGEAGVLEVGGEPADLIDAWKGAEIVVVVDAVSSGAPPGTVHRLDASEAPLPALFSRASTHAFSVVQAVELARALGKLPPRVIVYGIEGERFDAGNELTPAVAAAIGDATEAILREIDGTE